MKKSKLHDQEWRDFQPVLDPETSVEKFRKAIGRAEKRIGNKPTPSAPKP